MKNININEGLEAINRIKLLMEYSLDKTLNENLLVLNEQNKFQDPSTYAWSGPSNLATTSNQKFTAKIDEPSMEQFMDKFREVMYSPGGMGLEALLASTGVGAIGVDVAYAVLLLWDFYEKKNIPNKFSWLNVIFDAVGLVSAGIMTYEVINGTKAIKNINTLEDIEKVLYRNTSLIKGLSAIVKGSQNILSKLKDAFTFIVKKLKFSRLSQLWETIFGGIEKFIQKCSELLGASEKYSKALGKSGRIVSTQSAILYSAEIILKKLNDILIKKNVESSLKDIKINPEKKDEILLNAIKEDIPELNQNDIKILEYNKFGSITKIKIENYIYIIEFDRIDNRFVAKQIQ
jgi:hypothetical protein